MTGVQVDHYDQASERSKMLRDIFTTACEGGIGHWASLDVYRWNRPDDEVVAVGNAHDDGRQFRVSLADLDLAVVALTAHPRANVIPEAAKLPDYTRRSLRVAVAELAAGACWLDLDVEFDANEADHIFQYAALGEVIYG